WQHAQGGHSRDLVRELEFRLAVHRYRRTSSGGEHPRRAVSEPHPLTRIATEGRRAVQPAARDAVVDARDPYDTGGAMRIGRFASNEGRRGMRWLALWISAAATAAIGVLLLYLGPALFPMGKGSVLFPFLAQAPLGLMAAGMLGIVAGTAGI